MNPAQTFPRRACAVGYISWLAGLVVGCFTCWQQVRWYQDGHWIVTVHTHGGFIVLLHWIGWLEFYVLATSKVISGWLLTCDSAHWWWYYSYGAVVTLGDQVTGVMTWYPTQSQYPDSELTSSFPIWIIQSICLESDTYLLLSHWFYSTMGFESHDLPKWWRDAQLILRILSGWLH